MRTALFLLLTGAAVAAGHSTLVDRVGTTGFAQLEAESFHTLTLKERRLAYWLTQASVAIDPINYDQNSFWGLRQKALLEEILRHGQGLEPQALRKERNGKAYLQLKNFPRMKEGVGMLLSELMRIKAEGDYAAIKALVDKYGVHFDPKLRDQVVARYAGLDVPTFRCEINSELTAKFDAATT